MAFHDDDRTVLASRGMVCSVDHLASSAGVAVLRAGGSAADAAVAASAVLAVTTQHMCGMGGDLFALVHSGGPSPAALASVGHAGSGADAADLRADGFDVMPMRGDVRSATMPGCVDGWLALHGRFGRLPLAEVLTPAREYAVSGFPVSPLLARAVRRIEGLLGADDYFTAGPVRVGDVMRRPLLARAFDAIVEGGREAFYEGEFGSGLIDLGRGLFTADDLVRSCAAWETPLRVRAWGHDVWTVPPPSQGYLTLAGARIAEGLDLPDDPGDPGWAHLLSEAARWAGHDRPQVLFDGADGTALLDEDRLSARRAAIDPSARTAPPWLSAPGGTIYLCAADGDGMGVSLIQSNAAGWGCHLVVPGTGIFLQNRGIGFSLDPGHPAELAPGRRPPHTLAPTLVTDPAGGLTAVLGTQGGDIQPQVVLQLLARMLRAGQSPAAAVDAPRWMLGDGGFSTWDGDGPQVTMLESGSPPSWERGLTERGHRVVRAVAGANFGHAQAIRVLPDGVLAGAADPRAITGAASGW
jgi:gamma-glutamyltranspeptidase/glutathione hydrolase